MEATKKLSLVAQLVPNDDAAPASCRSGAECAAAAAAAVGVALDAAHGPGPPADLLARRLKRAIRSARDDDDARLILASGWPVRAALELPPPVNSGAQAGCAQSKLQSKKKSEMQKEAKR